MNIACGNCGTTFKVGPVKAGSKVLCPKCNTTLAVTATAAPPAPAIAPAPPAARRVKAASAKRKAPPQIPSFQLEKAQRSLQAIVVGAVALLAVSVVGAAVGAVVDDSARPGSVDRKDMVVAQATSTNRPVTPVHQGEPEQGT